MTDVCSSINTVLDDIISLAMNFTTQTSVTSSVACGCSIASMGPCDSLQQRQQLLHSSQCPFGASVREHIHVTGESVYADVDGSGGGDIWREACGLEPAGCNQCLLSADLSLPDGSLNNSHRLAYRFKQSSGIGSDQHITGSFMLTGGCVVIFVLVLLFC